MKYKKYLSKKQVINKAKRQGLTHSQINRVVKSYHSSKRQNQLKNIETKINKFKASNKASKVRKYLHTPLALRNLNKQLNKLNKVIDGLRQYGIVDKPLQRIYTSLFKKYLWVKELRAPTRQLKQERRHQRQHWVGLARANINLKKPKMTTYIINRIGQSRDALERFLRDKLNDYESDLEKLIKKGLREGVIKHLKQYYDTGIIYGYIDATEEQVFSPV